MTYHYDYQWQQAKIRQCIKCRQELSFAGDIFDHAIQFSVKPRVTARQPPFFLAQTREKVYICLHTKFHPNPGDARASVLSRDGELLQQITICILIIGSSEMLHFYKAEK